MALKKEHAFVGAVVGFGFYAYFKSKEKTDWTFWGVVSSVLAGIAIGVLPDILEPALKNPNHRHLFHSIALLSILISKYNKLGSNEFQKFIANLGMGAYLSHLILDLDTPKSLPLI